MHAPEVDILLVSFNTRELLRECLLSIQRHAAPVTVHTIVVDNASQDHSAEMVRDAFPEVRLVEAGANLGFAAANNLALREGRAPMALCLNADARLLPEALPRLRACLEGDARRVIAGPKLLNPDGSFQPSCRRFPNWPRNLWVYSGMTRRLPGHFHALHTWLDEAEHATATRVDMVSGACFLVRREYLESLGGFDGRLFLYEEELDIMLPARRRGLHTVYCPEAEVVHHGGASVSAANLSELALRHTFRSKYLVFRKHYGPASARATYLTDRLLFTLSKLRHPAQPSPLLDAARWGWKASFN